MSYLEFQERLELATNFKGSLKNMAKNFDFIDAKNINEVKKLATKKRTLVQEGTVDVLSSFLMWEKR